MREQNPPRIDVHTHILPGVDDGARDMDEACELLKAAAEQGVTAVIATPHYHRSQSPEGLSTLKEALEVHVREGLPFFDIYLGQETYYHEGLVEHLKQGKALTMAGSRYVLVEFDPGVPYTTLFRGIRQLLLAGYTPILAHMERYACLRNEAHLVDLMGSGCKFQMNYESLDGPFFQKEVRWCRKQVLEGRIHLLGSDMHRTDFRPPKLTGALRWLEKYVDVHELDRLTHENARKMIDNVIF